MTSHHQNMTNDTSTNQSQAQPGEYASKWVRLTQPPKDASSPSAHSIEKSPKYSALGSQAQPDGDASKWVRLTQPLETVPKYATQSLEDSPKYSTQSLEDSPKYSTQPLENTPKHQKSASYDNELLGSEDTNNGSESGKEEKETS